MVGAAVAAAMTSRIGAGPPRFHVGGMAGWVDTVYLGAYRAAIVRAAGGYAEDVGVNEDSELAIRMAHHGGVWFDPLIKSTYVPRGSLAAGREAVLLVRAIARHDREEAPRVRLGTTAGGPGPRGRGGDAAGRRHVAAAYTCVLAAGVLSARRTGPKSAALVPLTMATMHLSRGVSSCSRWSYQRIHPPHNGSQAACGIGEDDVRSARRVRRAKRAASR